jgi:hypothetical protein
LFDGYLLFITWMVDLTLCYRILQKKKATNDQENSTYDDHDFNGSNEDNDDKSYHSRVVDIATLAKQSQSNILPGHIVM